jgi:hypothetical protein
VIAGNLNLHLLLRTIYPLIFFNSSTKIEDVFTKLKNFASAFDRSRQDLEKRRGEEMKKAKLNEKLVHARDLIFKFN